MTAKKSLIKYQNLRAKYEKELEFQLKHYEDKVDVIIQDKKTEFLEARNQVFGKDEAHAEEDGPDTVEHTDGWKDKKMKIFEELKDYLSENMTGDVYTAAKHAELKLEVAVPKQEMTLAQKMTDLWKERQNAIAESIVEFETIQETGYTQHYLDSDSYLGAKYTQQNTDLKTLQDDFLGDFDIENGTKPFTTLLAGIVAKTAEVEDGVAYSTKHVAEAELDGTDLATLEANRADILKLVTKVQETVITSLKENVGPKVKEIKEQNQDLVSTLVKRLT